jgi:translation initiation factor IF-3
VSPSRLLPPLFAQQRRGAPPVVKEQRPPMNAEITANELRVVAPNPKGKDVPLGIMTLEEALAKARELGGLDLIMINDKADPPVCKIVDYSKYRYMLEKKAKEIKKNSKGTEIKEVKMSYKIDVHDYDVRKKNALKFIKQGNRVKCTVMFRGREVQYEQLGAQLLEKLAADLESVCLREGKAKREGRNLSLILQPRAEVMKAVNENRKAEERAKKRKKAEAFGTLDQDGKANGTPNGSIHAGEDDSLSYEDDDEDNDEDDDENEYDDDDDHDDDDDDDDEEEEEEEATLDELLGGDDLSDALFK